MMQHAPRRRRTSLRGGPGIAWILSALLVAAGLAAGPAPAQETEAPGVPEALGRIRAGEHAQAAAILEDVTDREPDNARAWALLGFALHSQELWERALGAHRRAAEFEQTAPTASYNAAMALARLDRIDEAFEWLRRADVSGRIDMTRLLLDPDAEKLREDPRLEEFLPAESEYADPFVEPYRIIHEWRGEAPGDQFGWIARAIGDVDGDGVTDVTTSAPTHAGAGPRAGRVYAYSGGSGALLWTADGEEGEQLGLGVEAAGDVDGDGVPDVIAGAPGGDRSLVLSGRDGSVVLELSAPRPGELFGRRVSGLGDVNGDGHADLLVGAPQNDAAGEDAGRVYLFSGADGSVLLRLAGEEPGDGFGSAVAGGGEEGERFLVIGAPAAGPGDRGLAYVYRDLSDEPAFVIQPEESGVSLGAMFVSVVGDVDADGHPDVYASDWADAALGRVTGRIYVHSGRSGARLLALGGETPGEGFGIGPADAGDADGDGHDDLIVGAWQFGGAAPSGGRTTLFSGRDGSVLRTWTGKVEGETFGFDATGVGDVDGDGAIDFLVTSAWSAVNGARSGRVYILAGGE